MEAKESSDKIVPEEKQVEESMESDEMLSGSESVETTENTDSSDKPASEEKSEPSRMPSEPTSGIELTSRSTTSTSVTQSELSGEKLEYSMSVEPTSNKVDKSSARDSGISTLSPENREVPTVPHESKSDADLQSLTTSTSELAIGEEKKSGTASEPTTEEQKLETSDSATLQRTEVLDTEMTESKTISAEKSTPPKKSIFGNIKRLFSPPKSGKSKERSKSMSPSEKAPQPPGSGTSNPEDASIASEEEDHMKKGTEKSGVIKSIKRSLSKIMVRTKSSTGDSTTLVSDEEIEKIEVPQPSEKKTEAPNDADKLTYIKPEWTDNRMSLTEERPSWDGTVMTNISSTTDSDVFPNDDSRRPSTAAGSTSEEAVASSLASSSDEPAPDIKEDQSSGEDMKKSSSNAKESKENAATSDPGETEACIEKEKL